MTEWLKLHLEQIDRRLINIENQVNQLVEMKGLILGQAKLMAILAIIFASLISFSFSLF